MAEYDQKAPREKLLALEKEELVALFEDATKNWPAHDAHGSWQSNSASDTRWRLR